MTRALSTTLSAAFLLFSSGLASASAGHRTDLERVPSEAVSIADLDLRTADGWHAATVRLQRAATRVCSAQRDASTQMTCRNQSLVRAKTTLTRRVAAGDLRLTYDSRADDGRFARR